jgi:hypothetical protein
MAFQIVQTELNDNGLVIGRDEIQPLYELREHALAMAEFDASRLGQYDFDSKGDYWWARDMGRTFKFTVEPVAGKIAA